MDNLISVNEYMGRGTRYTYDAEGNLTSITDVAGRVEVMTYDIKVFESPYDSIAEHTEVLGNSTYYDRVEQYKDNPYLYAKESDKEAIE